MPVNGDSPVVSEEEWHRTQPILLNNTWPFSSEAVCVVGVGGAVRRMNAAKFTVSDDIFEAVPVSPSSSGLVMLVESSGVPLNTQPETAARSLGNSSLATPCSTL